MVVFEGLFELALLESFSGACFELFFKILEVVARFWSLGEGFKEHFFGRSFGGIWMVFLLFQDLRF